MSEGSEAAEQVVRMMLSGGEVAVRLTGSAMKNGAALLLALRKNHKKVYGKVHLTKILAQTRDIRTFPMTPAQFRQFRKKARGMKILYAAIQDKRSKSAPVDVVFPTTELERANMVFDKMDYIPQQERNQDMTKEHPQEPKKEHRSEPASHDTRGNSSMRSEQTRMTNERPSIEQKLKDNKAALDQKKKQAPARTRTKNRWKGKSK